MGDCFDLERFRSKSAGYAMASPKPPRTLRKKTEPFLKGPIPLAWLSKAAGLGGSSLAVGLCLWFQHGVAREPGSIKVTKAVRRKLDLSPDRVYRGLNDLAAAGLIRFESRGRGHCPVVSILAIEGSGSESLGYSIAGESPTGTHPGAVCDFEPEASPRPTVGPSENRREISRGGFVAENGTPAALS